MRKYLRESELMRKWLVLRGEPVTETIEDQIEELLTEWATRPTTKQLI